MTQSFSQWIEILCLQCKASEYWCHEHEGKAGLFSVSREDQQCKVQCSKHDPEEL